jgi:hypothetical protein
LSFKGGASVFAAVPLGADPHPAAQRHLWSFDLAREAVPARIDEIECLDGHGPILLAARAIGWAQKEKLSNRQT